MPLSDTLKAALWMMGSVVSFSAMAVAGREMSLDLDTFEIMMYRSMIGVVVVLICARYFGTLGQIKRDRLGLHFIRNLCHFTGQNLWFFAITLIPFAQLFAFEFSVPIWVTLAAPLLLAERLTSLRILSVFTGFIGILIVTRPWAAGISPGIIAAALCALGFAGSAIFTKILTRTQTITCILFWLTVMQLAFGVICAGYDGDIALPAMRNIPWVFVVGLGGLFAHFCLTTALRLAPATVVMPVDFTRLPLIAVVGAVFYNEALEIWVVIGAIIIFASNYLNIWDENRKKRAVA
ncbi:multidrug DMT transporter permease [Amylibacter kogurei]|uniref:Multidrug DMT transporter permease n=1 Tax=Paramylibacter kogurei TaxID=1889778 RepID=A0A2G5K6F8_9RHOB|nr:DMT family transporter [Amylibacter kogurei]PIB25118.1 multidrug DMT transporter permease [Amylibacter kogurei]